MSEEARPKRIVASAPAKVILFGEHAVVYARPALAAAIDLRLYASVEPARGKDPKPNVDGHPLHPKYHSYIKHAYESYFKGTPQTIHTVSEVPSASGMGSSAALTVSVLTALNKAAGHELDRVDLAQKAFETEFAIQGAASPTDTSTSTFGGGLLVLDHEDEGMLWKAQKGEKEWYLHGVKLPSDISLVVGFTGSGSRTFEQVAKVRKFVNKSKFGMEVIDEIGKITLDGIKAFQSDDWEEAGRLMNRNHDLLAILGVNTKKLQKLVEGARKNSYGAKLTGAGGGGSMIAITDEPAKVARTLTKRGAKAYITKLVPEGARLEDGSKRPQQRRSAKAFRLK